MNVYCLTNNYVILVKMDDDIILSNMDNDIIL